MRRKFWWGDFSALEFSHLAPEKVIAVLPIAATEQHGPHLPVGTDQIINEGHCRALREALPASLDVRVLPVEAIGKSNEHLWAKGTVTHTAGTAIQAWVEIGLSVARAGVRKLVIVNSHGGNEEMMGIVARELRVRADMFVVKTSWSRFGVPDGLVPADELRHGIHGGDVETSLVLHLAPDLVDMGRAGNFVSVAARDERDYAYLRPTGTHAYSWIASDVHPSGAIGNAAAASADKGRKILDHHVAGFVALLEEVARYPLPMAADAQDRGKLPTI